VPDGLGRRAGAELAGTALLLAGIVGSGIMASRLTDDGGLQLLINAFATAAVLVAAIMTFGPVSGAHLNPAVTLVDRWFGGVTNREAAVYVAAQLVGAIGGVMLANVMFDLDVADWSTTARDGSHLWLAEVVATAGLVIVIFGVLRAGRAEAVPYVVAAFIAGAFFFTSSTSFANPAVTIGRMFSDTFAGIAPASAPPFLVAELVGAGVAYGAVRALFPDAAAFAADVVVPHEA
jgi:arsenate reductase